MSTDGDYQKHEIKELFVKTQKGTPVGRNTQHLITKDMENFYDTKSSRDINLLLLYGRYGRAHYMEK